MQNRCVPVLSLMAALVFAGSLAVAQPTKPFPDVPKDHWAYQAVMELKEKGILIGYPDGTFNGEGTKGKQTNKATTKKTSLKDLYQKRIEELQSKEGLHFDFEITSEIYLAYRDLRDAALLEKPEGRWIGSGRMIERYDVALILKRTIDRVKIHLSTDPQGKGISGVEKNGDPGTFFTPKQVQELLVLATEFKGELASLGVDIKKVVPRLEDLKTEQEIARPTAPTRP